MSSKFEFSFDFENDGIYLILNTNTLTVSVCVLRYTAAKLLHVVADLSLRLTKVNVCDGYIIDNGYLVQDTCFYRSERVASNKQFEIFAMQR